MLFKTLTCGTMIRLALYFKIVLFCQLFGVKNAPFRKFAQLLSHRHGPIRFLRTSERGWNPNDSMIQQRNGSIFILPCLSNFSDLLLYYWCTVLVLPKSGLIEVKSFYVVIHRVSTLRGYR